MSKFDAHFDHVPESKETRLRPYNKDDIEILCDAAERFIPELPNYEGITVAKDRLAFLLRNNYGNAAFFQCWVLVDDKDVPVGAGAGYCVQGMVTWDYMSNDSFLFVLPGWRTLKNVDKLMDAYTRWAIARNAVLIQASQTGGYEIDRMDKYMLRKGYKRVGPLYHLRRDSAYLQRQLNALGERK